MVQGLRPAAFVPLRGYSGNERSEFSHWSPVTGHRSPDCHLPWVGTSLRDVRGPRGARALPVALYTLRRLQARARLVRAGEAGVVGGTAGVSELVGLAGVTEGAVLVAGAGVAGVGAVG